MRIVYFVMAHKNAEQVIRLINRLDDEDVHFFIHVDLKANDVYQAVCAALADRPNCQFVKRIRAAWATFDLVRIPLICIKALCDSGLSYDFAVKLSAQDYPLTSNAVIKQTLSGYTGKQLIKHAPLPIDAWVDGGWRRVRRYYFTFGSKLVVYPPYKFESSIEKMVARLLSLFLLSERKIPHGYQVYGGEAWWCLTQPCIDYVNQFVTTPKGRDILRAFHFTRNTAELFMHTVVMNSPFKDTVVNRNLHYIDWPTDQHNPEILDKTDFDKLIESGQLFARKFDVSIDSEILDMLDEHIKQVED
ncbi:MAG: glycosyl transferase family 14 [Anaerolineae bacterium]|nr:glycosyl transferase family 14 [Anaerolineae bacterium]